MKQNILRIAINRFYCELCDKTTTILTCNQDQEDEYFYEKKGWVSNCVQMDDGYWDVVNLCSSRCWAMYLKARNLDSSFKVKK